MGELNYKEFSSQFRYVQWSDRGELVHLSHATGLCAGTYSAFAGLLAKTYTILGLDLRGHGQTVAPWEPSQLKDWEVLYHDQLAFFRHFKHPLTAVGHSMGGTVSAVLAARYPGLISKLVLIEPGFMPPNWRPFVYFVQKTGLYKHVPFVTTVTRRKKSWKNKTEALEELHAKGPFRSWRKEILKDYIDEGTILSADGMLTLRCHPAWEGQILAMAPTNIWQEVSHIQCPTLIIYGEKSNTFLPSVAAKVKKMVPHAIIRKMSDIGHFIPMEQPEELADIVSQFISKGYL